MAEIINMQAVTGKEMAEIINKEAEKEEEKMFHAEGPEVLKEIRKGRGLLSDLPGGLHRAAMDGDWEAAQKIFDQDRNAMSQRISTMGFTALHVAASCGQTEFVVKLVELIDPRDLEIKDQLGRTALHHVALACEVSAAGALLKKSRNLHLQEDCMSGTPLFYAARWRHRSKAKEMIEYLYEVNEDGPSPHRIYTGDSGQNLVVAITISGCYGIALKILKCHRDLALAVNEDGMSILHVFAMRPDLSFKNSEISKVSIWKLLTKKGRSKKLETKKREQDALELIELVCKKLRNQSDSDILKYFFHEYGGKPLLYLAVEKGVIEVVQRCLKYFPDLLWHTEKYGTLLQAAIEYRRVDIFNHLIDLTGENTKGYAELKIDEHGNNILHLAAHYEQHSHQLMIHTEPGPAFQMRAELQWFKAVEALVSEQLTMEKNKMEKEKEFIHQVPRALFYMEHEELLKDAKKWMKEISNSSMVIAALVATVAFAAMITVPGGNNSATGLPILSNRKLFMTFSVTNTLSMIFSAVTLLVFMSVYTQRFTEEYFLNWLLIIVIGGILCLFIAVFTMMIAFGIAIGLALQHRFQWIYIPITVVACCPVLIFIFLKHPLLYWTFESGPGKYRRKSWGPQKKKNGLDMP